jgi:hypothetical protein
MDFKAPYKALKMRKALMAALDDVEQGTRASPLIDWLRVTFVPCGCKTS